MSAAHFLVAQRLSFRGSVEHPCQISEFDVNKYHHLAPVDNAAADIQSIANCIPLSLSGKWIVAQDLISAQHSQIRNILHAACARNERRRDVVPIAQKNTVTIDH